MDQASGLPTRPTTSTPVHAHGKTRSQGTPRTSTCGERNERAKPADQAPSPPGAEPGGTAREGERATGFQQRQTQISHRPLPRSRTSNGKTARTGVRPGRAERGPPGAERKGPESACSLRPGEGGGRGSFEAEVKAGASDGNSGSHRNKRITKREVTPTPLATKTRRPRLVAYLPSRDCASPCRRSRVRVN